MTPVLLLELQLTSMAPVYMHTTVLAVSDLGSLFVSCYQPILTQPFFCVCVLEFPFGLRDWVLFV